MEVGESPNAADSRVFFINIDPTKRQGGPGKKARAQTARINWRNYRARKRLQRQEDAKDKVALSKPEVLLSIQPALSPVFGAVRTSTFENGDMSTIGQVSEHTVSLMWPDLLHDTASITAWFIAFCEQPIIFHGFHYAAAAHADALRGVRTWSRQPDMLIHKSKTMLLLNQMITNLGQVDLEIVIHIVLMLTWNELEDDPTHLSIDSASHLSPPFPNAGWLNVFGNMAPVEAHAQALARLVDHAGGLQRLQFPGLASIIALGDLIAASMQLTLPRYTCFWPKYTSIRPPSGLMETTRNRSPGEGFRHCLEDYSPQSLSILTEAAAVDHSMDWCRSRRLLDTAYQALIYARNASQHHLLSNWLQLTQFEPMDGRSSQSLGYLCNTTALMYSTSIMFPLPSHLSWRSRLAETLKALIEATRGKIHHREVVIWCLTVAAVTSYGLPERRFFETVLFSMLTEGDVHSRESHQSILENFIWSPAACELSLELLWRRNASQH